jgi:Raf kinase inhibitor-like YbhB/YbcL family protein
MTKRGELCAGALATLLAGVASVVVTGVVTGAVSSVALGVASGVAFAEGATISVSSSAFRNGGAIPSEYTCEGRGTAPPLSWGEVPSGTKSVAVIVTDPDAPGGSFAHLAAFNLPPTRRSLPTDALSAIGPGAALKTARNSSGQPGFAPICPPHGTHRYHFVVMALDTMLDLPPSAGAADVEKAAAGHVLGRGELVGSFSSRR